MYLIIVESPSKGKTIEKLLGSEYKVLSSYGHIRDLPKSELGIDIEQNFKPKYIIPKKSKKTIQLLKKEVEKTDLIILSLDPDREGEAIAWHLVQALGLNEVKSQKSKVKNYQRIVFHEITKTAIEEALKNPRPINMNLVDAQQARRILDRIVGYKLSPFLWKKVARGLSAGRVQSVAVRLVAERDKEIQNFTPQEYWSIETLLKKIRNPKSEIRNKSQIQNSKSQTEFSALLIKRGGEIIPKLGIKSKKEADEIVKDLKGAEYKIINVEKKEVKRNPLPPFTTSTLQQESWQRFKWPAKFTMKVAQQLYERGLTTYHRTDSLNLSDLSLFAVKKFIINQYGKEYWAGFLRKYKAKGRVQEAHEAIRPTYPDKTPEKLSEKLEKNQLKLYDLIWRRFVSSQMAQAIFDSTVVEIEANPKSKILNPKQIQNSKLKIKNRYTFRANGQTLKFNGFLKISPIKYEEVGLPALEINEILELLNLIPSQHFTQPPPRYNEASLIKTLEQNEIGRPSTYAPILSTIQERNYIEKNEQKKFQPTEIGTVVNDLLVNHFPKIVDMGFTAEMEKDLDEIAEGKIKWVPVIKEFYEPFEENLKQKYQEVSKKEFTEKPTEKICPKCQAPLLIRLGKYGKFYACSKFPKCRYTESLKENILGVKCPRCEKGEITQKRTKKNKIFYGCNQFPKCDFALWDKPTGEKCPKCDSLLVQMNRGQIHPVKSAEGGAKQFNRVRCSNKECDFIIKNDSRKSPK